MRDSEVSSKHKCLGVDCENDAGALQCPTCQKIGKERFFCSQDCFKKSWVRISTHIPDISLHILTNYAHRVNTRRSTNHRVTPSASSSLQRLFLSQIQQRDTTIPSPRFRTQAPYGRYILCRQGDRCRRRSSTRIMQKMAFRGQNRICWGGGTSRF